MIWFYGTAWRTSAVRDSTTDRRDTFALVVTILPDGTERVELFEDLDVQPTLRGAGKAAARKRLERSFARGIRGRGSAQRRRKRLPQAPPLAGHCRVAGSTEQPSLEAETLHRRQTTGRM